MYLYLLTDVEAIAADVLCNVRNPKIYKILQLLFLSKHNSCHTKSYTLHITKHGFSVQTAKDQEDFPTTCIDT